MKRPIICAASQERSSPSFSKLATISGLMAGAMLLVSSCQTYTPEPLDMNKHAREWQQRSPSDKMVREFARQLSKKTAKPKTFNPSNGISLHEAQVIALVYNPDLRISRLRAGVATAKAEHAGLWKDPEFGLDVLRVTDGVPKPWNVTGSLSFTIPLTGRIQTKKKATGLEQQIEFARLREMELKVVHDLATIWVQWSSLHAELKETQRMTKVIADILETTDKLVELGEIPKNEASLLHIDLVKHQVESTKLKGDITTAKQKIRTLLGLSPKASLSLIPSILPRVKSRSDDRIKETNPTLKRLTLEYGLAEMQLRQEIQKQYPDLKLGPVFESDQGQSSIGLINGIPLPILNSNKGGIATARAKRKLAQAALETEYERKTGKIAIHKAKLKTLRNLSHETQQKLIPVIDKQVKETRRLTQIGEANLLVLLESLTRSHDTKLRLIELTKQQSITELQIQLLQGSN